MTEELKENEKITALVKMQIEELIEKPRKVLVDYLALQALGSENIGKYYLDKFTIDPIGMVYKEVVFEVTGFVKKHAKVFKKKKQSTKKKIVSKKK